MPILLPYLLVYNLLAIVSYTIFIFEMLLTVVVKAGNEDVDKGKTFS